MPVTVTAQTATLHKARPAPQRPVPAATTALPHQRGRSRGAPPAPAPTPAAPAGPRGDTAPPRAGPLPPPHPLPAAAARAGSAGRSGRRGSRDARGSAILGARGSAMAAHPPGSGGGRRGLTMVADGGGCCGAGGSRQWRRLGPVSLASAERAEESADVSRSAFIGRRRRGAGPAPSACAAAPLYPADSVVGRLFRLGGTTWMSPPPHRDNGDRRRQPRHPQCGEKAPPRLPLPVREPPRSNGVGEAALGAVRAPPPVSPSGRRARGLGHREKAAGPSPVSEAVAGSDPAPVPQGARTAHAPGVPVL